jgi:DNA-directed RNA polymerase specialized sigma24 family protein
MRADVEDDFTEYVKARLPRLRQAAFALCGDVHRADDVVQSTLVSLYRHWRRAVASDNLDAYVHRMLVHDFIDERRLRWSRVVLGDRDELDRMSVVVDMDSRTDVVAALRQLPRASARFWCCGSSATCRSRRPRRHCIAQPATSKHRPRAGSLLCGRFLPRQG